MKIMFALAGLCVVGCSSTLWAVPTNFVVVVADDLGWRDTGYAGSPHAKTPSLDAMAKTGVRFDYFYPAQQMCSPGRFAIMTGRNPIRTGLHHLGAMRPQEITIPQVLKGKGYHTGHFGKWHLGQAATSPAKMGFDRALWQINYFDLGAKLQVGDTKEMVALEGDTSVATMKLALEFISEQAAAKQPFFVQVCFGSPHSPHQATDEYRAIYSSLNEKQQNFYGEVSGVDAAVGQLRSRLRELKIADDTMVWFMSDNGGITPLSQDPSGKGKQSVGNRTASVLEWPAGVPQPLQTNFTCGHVDVFPTILEIAGASPPDQRPLDGVSLLPMLQRKVDRREKPLGFILWNGKGDFSKVDLSEDSQGVWIDGSLKLVVAPQREPADATPNKQAADKPQKKKPQSAGAPVQLYDIYADPAHENNLANAKPEDVARLRQALESWQKGVRASVDGADFAKQDK